MDDRRKNPRFKVRVEAQVTHGAQRFRGLLKDICRDAALVEVDHRLEMGSELALALELPGTGGTAAWSSGKVVRLGPLGAGPRTPPSSSPTSPPPPRPGSTSSSVSPGCLRAPGILRE